MRYTLSMKREIHLMVDIECLSTRRNAVVTNVGLLRFNPHTQITQRETNVYLELESQGEHGRVVSPETINFWLKQDREAQKQITSTHRVKMDEFFDIFNDYTSGISKIWAKSTNFDLEILKSLHDSFDKKWPVRYSKYTDVRSIYWLNKKLKSPDIEMDEERVSHDALSDCQIQVIEIYKLFNLINNKGKS